MEKQRIIGLYFGTFNPPHIGHLEIIKSSLKYCDAVMVIPSAQPPGKQQALDSFNDRFRMMDEMISITGLTDYIIVSPIEGNLEKPSYTINTVRKIKEYHPNDRLTIIMGADNWMEIDKWKDSEELKDLVDFLVYPREDIMLLGGSKVQVLEIDEINISSSIIRKYTRREIETTPWLTDEIKSYILKHELYGSKG